MSERHLVLRDEAHFFEVVRTTHDLVEAEDMLRRARIAAIAEREVAWQKEDGDLEARLNLLLTYLNDEIRALNKRQDRIRIKEAIKDLFGEEGWGKFVAYTQHQIIKPSQRELAQQTKEAIRARLAGDSNERSS